MPGCRVNQGKVPPDEERGRISPGTTQFPAEPLGIGLEVPFGTQDMGEPQGLGRS